MDTKVILLIEDNEDDVELTLRAFKKSKIANNVIVVNDGQEAIDYMFGKGKYEDRKEYPLPAVILLDLNIPKINGLDVLKNIRNDEAIKYIPVVILTSSTEERDIIAGYGLGCNSYIRKPVDFKKFTDAVSQLGLYWLLLNQPPCCSR